MPRNTIGKQWYRMWDRSAVVLLIAALAVGVGLGGSGSASVRTTVQILALAACVGLAFAMTADGRFRWIKSSLWLIPIGLGCLALFQTFAPVTAGSVATRGGENVAAPGASWNRLASLEWACWAGVLFLATAAAAHGVRSVGRLKALAAAIAGVLLLVGAAATLQALAGSTNWLGLYSAEDRKLSPWTRDWVGADTSLGLRAAEIHEPWEAAEERQSDAKAQNPDWYAAKPKTAGFGTFVSSADWSAAAALVVPFALAAGVVYLRRRRSGGDLGWGFDAPRGWMFVATAVLLGMIAAVLDKPGTAVAVCVVSLGALIVLAPREDRGSLTTVGAIAAVSTAATAIAATAWSGGVGRFVAQWNAWVSDSSAVARIANDHLWTGCGLGALGDLWPLYRTAATGAAPAGSSLLTLVAEVGVPFAACAALLVALAVLRWRRVAPNLPSEARLVLAGVGAGIAGWAAAGVFGPGADSPPVLLVAAAFLGALIRGLAVGVRQPEALTHS